MSVKNALHANQNDYFVHKKKRFCTSNSKGKKFVWYGGIYSQISIKKKANYNQNYVSK